MHISITDAMIEAPYPPSNHVHSRNPEHHSRPTFEDLSRKLDRDPETLLSWREQGKIASPKALVLGAPLVEGKHLYQDLQETYK